MPFFRKKSVPPEVPTLFPPMHQSTLKTEANAKRSQRTTRQAGCAAEDAALALLQRAGLTLLERNYRTPGRGGGEIDLIMREPDGTVVFIEVRARANREFGGAGGSISAAKQRRIVFAAHYYLLRCPSPPPCRFDAVLLEPDIQWLRAAFEAG
jgi:putative endonuclease